MDRNAAKMEFYPPASLPIRRFVPPATAQRIRIIGGSCRGRKVTFPAVPGLRPTPDRVRETLFNWLGQDLAGMATLDLFAGSGVLSLESLSRGARLAVAVDRDPRAVAALRSNAAALDLDKLEVLRMEASAYLRQEARSFDVLFLDPPFGDSVEWPWLLEACRARCVAGGRIYAEAGVEVHPPDGLTLLRAGRAGQVYYHLFAC